ncbi:hypothetical protein L1987_64756 [Smallanthus sonchifolius]|uniref:Uncharacterized protein n=1 Tax=Smallanthus sonchifolius TaxID=185202 RepID=A0ACB9BSH3_9ASTR|nr:hypothetical protein L1987_64756 [Smallanthus sonchifolius]
MRLASCRLHKDGTVRALRYETVVVRTEDNSEGIVDSGGKMAAFMKRMMVMEAVIGDSGVEKGVVTSCDGDGDSDLSLLLLTASEWSWWFTMACGGCQLVTLREGDENSSLMVSFMG